MTTNTAGDQIEYWNVTAGPKWVRLQETIDGQIRPLGLAAIDRLAPQAGERILDLGCGCGDTTIELARRVGAGGSVFGVDVSGPMLEHAAKRLAAAGASHARVEQGDLTTFRFEPASFDAAFSRFGVMFFPDPTAAFRNVRGALRPGGRLGFVCWQPVDRNPWMFLALMAAAEHVTLPPRPGPEDPGPFSFGDPARVERILAGAGFTDVALEPHEVLLDVVRGATLEEAVDFLLQLGPTANLLKDATDELRARVHGAVCTALSDHFTPTGLRLGSSSWIVTARAP